MNGTSTLSLDMPAGLRNKIALRLIPLLSLLYLLNIMDRMNVGYARDQMEPDLNIAPWVFTWGSGIFYFGYLCFEVPANLILERVGARRWIARIMITWGMVSCMTALVWNTWTFFGVRILLGVAEAGFFPGIVLYLTYWFPARERARAMAFFMTGVAISGVISNLVSGVIMDVMPGVGGLKGWQWLFVMEGIPSMLVGFFVWWYLPDGPRAASWLSDAERAELAERLSREDAYRRKNRGGHMLVALKDWRVWLLIVAYFTVAIGTNTAAFSFAKMIKYRFHEFSETEKGGMVALPSFCALILMLVLGRLSDLTKMRRTMFAVAGIIGAAGWLGVLFLHQPWPLPVLEPGRLPSLSPEQMETRWLFLGALCIAQAGMISMIPTFWVLPTSFLTGTAAAAGIALINSLGNIGGLVGSSIFDALGHWSIMLIVLLGGLMVYLVRHDPTLDRGLAPGHGERGAPATGVTSLAPGR